MKIFLAGVFAGIILAALGPETPGAEDSARPRGRGRDTASPAFRGKEPRQHRNPLEIPRAFRDLPIAPAGSDREDCFNDEIPYTPIPQG
jgi:hypothetical protein